MGFTALLHLGREVSFRLRKRCTRLPLGNKDNNRTKMRITENRKKEKRVASEQAFHAGLRLDLNVLTAPITLRELHMNRRSMPELQRGTRS
jgi:hypothetical protein